MIRKDIIDLFRVPADKKVRLKDHNPGWKQTEEFEDLGKDALKERAKQVLDQNLERPRGGPEPALRGRPVRGADRPPGDGRGRQGRDDQARHERGQPAGLPGVQLQEAVGGGTRPQLPVAVHRGACRSAGRIGIFNRSYYEDVLVVKVHPELIGRQLPREKGKVGKKFWEERYEDINAFERHLVRNGTVVLKFFLNVSKDEQKRRFLERLNRPEKNWKFSPADLAERGHWDDYMDAYEDALSATSTEWAPWYVVPADHKWVTRAVVADVVTTAIRGLDLKYPEVTAEQRKLLEMPGRSSPRSDRNLSPTTASGVRP